MMHKAKTMTNWDRLEFHSCSGSMENLKELYEGIKLKPTCDAQIKRPQKENNPPACFFFFFTTSQKEGGLYSPKKRSSYATPAASLH